MPDPATLRTPPMDFDAERLKQRASKHLRRWAWLYALLAVGVVLLSHFFTLGINTSPSLPHRLYVIHKGSIPHKGELVAFRWPGGGPYRPGTTFVKILAGLPGDSITRIDRSFFVNQDPVGTAKRRSRIGVPLKPGPTGTLPPGRYYVRAPHPDSLDSRYALTGWIARTQIIGRAYAIF